MDINRMDDGEPSSSVRYPFLISVICSSVMVSPVDFASSRSTESSHQVIALKRSRHAFVGVPDEYPRNPSCIASRLPEGVAPDGDGIAKVAVAPHRARTGSRSTQPMQCNGTLPWRARRGLDSRLSACGAQAGWSLSPHVSSGGGNDPRFCGGKRRVLSLPPNV